MNKTNDCKLYNKNHLKFHKKNFDNDIKILFFKLHEIIKIENDINICFKTNFSLILRLFLDRIRATISATF